MILKKSLLLIGMVLVNSISLLSQVIAEQDFDGSASWTYSSDVGYFSHQGTNTLNDVYPLPDGWSGDGFYGIISLTDATGLDYAQLSGNLLGELDLDDEGDFGTGGEATTTFSSVNVSTFTSVQITFDYDVEGYNANSDEAFYEVFEDGVGQGRVVLQTGSTVGDDAEGSVTYNVTAGTSTVELQIIISNNGSSGYSGFDNFQVTGVPSTSNTITTTTVSPLTYNVDCSTGESGTVDFTSTGTFNAGNIFTVELSDNTGSFTSATSIGTLALSGNDPSGTINITVPAGTTSGSSYRMRVVSDDPIVLGSDNGTDIEVIYTPCPTPLPASGGLLINEFSNGSAGNEEFYEFIIAGQCGETVDVRGYILDDNNGTFSEPSGYPGSSGIADGHLRLTNNAQWSNIPVGSVIVIYNNDERNGSLPADDPFDSDNDSLYVIPHNNSVLFEIDGSIPNASDPDSTYSPATYSGTAWSALSLRNGGDAVQIRRPDGSYFHGVSYGGSEITGGPEGTKITTSSMGGSNGSFGSGDFTDPANWSTGTAPADETPGTYNNAANENWLRLMRDPDAATCPVNPLPVTLVLFEGEYINNGVQLYWESSTEQNNNYYEVLHSIDGYNFTSIGTKDGAGSVSHSLEYNMQHRDFKSGINYYKLRSVDFDGTIHEKGIIAVVVELDQVYYDHVSTEILFPNNDDYYIFDTSGKLINQSNGKSSILFNKQGVFFVINKKTGSSTKLIIQ